MNLQQYKNETLPEEQLEALTRKLVSAKLDQDHRNKWKQKLNKDHGIQRDSSEAIDAHRRFNLFAYWKIAAAVILVVVIAISSITFLNRGLQYQVDKLIVEAQFTNYEGGKKGTIISTDREIEVLQEQASLAFNKGKFREANALYLQLIELDKTQNDHYFFSGFCFLKLNEFDKSAEQFKAVQKINTEDSYQEEAKWFLSLALIKQEKKKEAQAALASIKKGEWKYLDAQKLLKAF